MQGQKQEPSSPEPASPEPSQPAKEPSAKRKQPEADAEPAKEKAAKRKQPEADAEASAEALEHSVSICASQDSLPARKPKRSRLGDAKKAVVNRDLPEEEVQVQV